MPDLRSRRLLRPQPNRHARGHASAEAHPLVTSYEPGEHWRNCFEEDAFVR